MRTESTLQENGGSAQTNLGSSRGSAKRGALARREARRPAHRTDGRTRHSRRRLRTKAQGALQPRTIERRSLPTHESFVRGLLTYLICAVLMAAIVPPVATLVVGGQSNQVASAMVWALVWLLRPYIAKVFSYYFGPDDE